MKKLILYTLSFLILLPITTQTMFRKTFNINNAFSKTNKFFNSKNFHTSAPRYDYLKNFEKPSPEIYAQFEQLDNKLDKINLFNAFHNKSYWSEYKISSDDSTSILKQIDNIKPENINKRMNWSGDTYLNTCIRQTSHYPDSNTEEIIKKVLEKGAVIDNPQVLSFPVWLAALQGNAGAYNVLVDGSPETHLSEKYEGKTLKLSHVIAFGLKRLKTMEDHYSSELQKIKNGERKGYTYSNHYRSQPYHQAIPNKLECVSWFKNKFQKIQDRNHYYFSKSNSNFTTNVFENESLINSFLEERSVPFHEYARGKMHEENFFTRKYWD